MAWHVLLIGCATDGLCGVAADLSRMRRIVQGCKLREAAIEELPAATRAQIVDAFTRLVARVRPGDGVLVYYSGHGRRLVDPVTGEVAYAIVPVGASETLEGDGFGYVLREELGRWFSLLTAITRNVTWIADCCHAAGIMRSERLVRSVPDDLKTRFAERRRELLAGLAPADLDPQGNPHLVCVCASASERRAFEDGEHGGRLTRALEESLVEVGYTRLVCEELGRRVAGKLSSRGQVPVFTGPVERWWLTSWPAERRAFATSVLHHRGTLIAGGRLLDQRAGDRYVVLGADRGAVATLLVTAVHGFSSETERDAASGHGALSVGATAVLRSAGEPRGAVELAVAEERRDALATALTGSGYLVLAGEAVAPVVARVSEHAGSLRVCDREGQVAGAWPAAEELAGPCAAVVGLARQAALLGVRPAESEQLQTRYELRAAPEGGAIVIEHRDGPRLYASAFYLCPSGQIRLLTRGQPNGEAVLPGRTTVLHFGSGQPPGTGRGRVVVLLGDDRVDLRGWTGETFEVQPPEARRGGVEGTRFGVHVLDG